VEVDKADEERFRQFVAGRSDSLLRTAYLLTGDRGKAEDLLQTALVKTYLSWGRIKHDQAVEGYTRKIMANTATSWWRRKWSAEQPTDILPERGQPDASSRVADTEEMRRFLGGLPARQRAVLVLRYFADLSEAQVADELGISRGAVSGYANRGLNTLRERMLAETSYVRARPDLGRRVTAQGKATRRNRQRLGVAVTGTAALIAVLALVITLGRPVNGPTPAETPSPSVPASSGPTVSPDPSNSPLPAISDPTTYGVLRNGTIVTNGSTVTIPAPIDAATQGVERVTGGWLVHSITPDGGCCPQEETHFLADDGSLRAFQPSLKGGTIAVSADGARMVAYVRPSTFHLFALPQLTRVATFNQPAVSANADVVGLWLAGDRVVAHYRGAGDLPGWEGAVVHNLTTRTDQVIDDLDPAAISGDGRIMSLRHQVGSGPDTKHCVSITTVADRLAPAHAPFCQANGDLGGGALSADGAWIALTFDQPGSANTQVWVYRTADVRTGKATPVRKITSQGGQQFIGWLDGPRILVVGAESTVRAASICPVDGGSCVNLPEVVGAAGIVLGAG
jgi:RNA polymerase sigma-70 factor, ECF subfamily